MKRKNILILGAALLMTAPAMSATPDDNNDGARQTVTVCPKNSLSSSTYGPMPRWAAATTT